MVIGIVGALIAGFVIVPLLSKRIGKPPIPGWAIAVLFIVMFMLGARS